MTVEIEAPLDMKVAASQAKMRASWRTKQILSRRKTKGLNPPPAASGLLVYLGTLLCNLLSYVVGSSTLYSMTDHNKGLDHKTSTVRPHAPLIPIRFIHSGNSPESSRKPAGPWPHTGTLTYEVADSSFRDPVFGSLGKIS